MGMLVAAMFLVIGGAFFAVGWKASRKALRFRSTAVRTQGWVVDHSPQRERHRRQRFGEMRWVDETVWVPRVKYRTPDGREFTRNMVEAAQSDAPRSPGYLDVLYQPSDPQDARPARIGDLVVTLGFAIAGGALLLAAVIIVVANVLRHFGLVHF